MPPNAHPFHHRRSPDFRLAPRSRVAGIVVAAAGTEGRRVPRSARSRLHRDPLLAPLDLQRRDLALLQDLYYFRFAAAPALHLSARWASGGGGAHYYIPKRIAQLWRAGYIERFRSSQTLYLHGSEPFIYTIGSGKASAAARTGLRPANISPDRWKQVLAEAAPARDRVRHALRCIGIDPAEIERVLHNNTELALKHYAGESSGVRHHVLAAEFLSKFWFDARMRGDAVKNIQPDGVADLSLREPEPRRYRDLVTASGVVVIKPDCLFTIAGKRYALEAETGTSSAAKLRLKLRRYGRLFELADPLYLFVHCATQTHLDLVASIIGETPHVGAMTRATTAEMLADLRLA
jgi:hypothetical protein